jgi:two-component system sensor histidine kinase KdpD
MTDIDERPDPDALLERIGDGQKQRAGKLKIFLGYAAGVGKTYAMLEEAHALLASGIDVIAGYIEPHTRPDTLALASGIPSLPPREILHKTIRLLEFDLDGALARKPAVILVDELAHSNAEGSRNAKRYQDVEELLTAGIDVYTTMNVQHVESLNDVVRRITRIVVRETVPDYIVDRAERVKLIDIDPDELLRRFAEGKIYAADKVSTARRNFFTSGNLSSLREIAMRKAADRVSRDAERPGLAAGEKILVCVGPSPSSASCIRAAARMAGAWHAPWVAVTVLRGDESAGLRENAALAGRLGAKIVSLTGADIALTIAEYAKATGVTNIVIGKRKRQDVYRNPFKPEFADKLAYLLPDVEVHIIPDKSTAAKYRRANASTFRDLFRKAPSPRHSAVAVGVLIAATLVSCALRALGVGDHNIIMVYILGVLVISRYTEGYLYGCVSSVLAVLAFNFFFTEPYYTLNTIQPGYPITFLIMFLVSAIMSAMTVRMKAQIRLSIERERRTEVLYDFNKKLLVACDLGEIRSVVEDQLFAIFGKKIYLHADDPVTGENSKQGNSRQLSANEQSVIHWVFANGKPAGTGTATLSLLSSFYAPVTGRDGTIGVIEVACETGRPLSRDNMAFVEIVSTLIAIALERQGLSDRQRTMELEAERERMRYDFLRGLSHDLRTPLTAILGASNVLLENGDILDSDARELFVSDIRCDAQWLMRMVENVLSITKIGDGTLRIVKKDEAVEEVVAEAVSQIRAHFPSIKLTARIPEDLLVVPMDGTMIEQVLINLVENAVKYAGATPKIEITVSTRPDAVAFAVHDDGAGLDEADIPTIFDGPVAGNRRTGDSSRGLGIGLMICEAIVKAHDGTIAARNREGGGAEFKFTLPRAREMQNGNEKTRPAD